jgi:hypothetical protein
MDNNQSIYNEDVVFTLLKILGLGMVIIIGYIIIDAHFQANEYPMLSTQDSLKSERVSSLEKDRGITFVNFESGRKYKLSWGDNLNYEDFPTITSVLRIGDLVTKKPGIDTITIQHSNKEYHYVLGHVIEKKTGDGQPTSCNELINPEAIVHQ